VVGIPAEGPDGTYSFVDTNYSRAGARYYQIRCP
jgi:hypothetical protein